MNFINYDDLDPGIRRTVHWLRAHGFETTDSGDGVSKTQAIFDGEALDVPHAFMKLLPAALVTESMRL